MRGKFGLPDRGMRRSVEDKTTSSSSSSATHNKPLVVYVLAALIFHVLIAFAVATYRSWPEHRAGSPSDGSRSALLQEADAHGEKSRVFVREPRASDVLAIMSQLTPASRKSFAESTYIGRYVRWKGTVIGVSDFSHRYAIALDDRNWRTDTVTLLVPLSARASFPPVRENDVIQYVGEIVGLDARRVRVRPQVIDVLRAAPPARQETGIQQSDVGRFGTAHTDVDPGPAAEGRIAAAPGAPFP